MSILNAIEKRRAARALDEKPIPRETLERLAKAAHLAPSCMNNQPWRIVVVADPVPLAALKETLSPGNYWARKAPAIAAFITSLDWDARLEGGRDYAFFDLGMAAMAFQLQAVSEGLIAHPIAGFNPAAAKIVLGVPEEAVLVTLVVLGFPGDPSGLNEKHLASERSERTRKPIEEVSAFDAWNDQLLPPRKG